ncbi:MAG: response regulator transcription factor [Verrucomicrobiales bacterium]
MKILIAEDDANTRRGLAQILDGEGYETVEAADGREAIALFGSEQPDAVCLDIMMPEVSGYDVCKAIRKRDPQVPILFISAKSEEVDTVLGLELGADDFIVKPFGVKAVIARIRAVARRAIVEKPERAPSRGEFAMDDLRVVPEELRAYRGDDAIDLSLRDLRILKLLHDRRGRAVTRDQLFDQCWGMNFLPNSRCLDQHISQLRKRVEADPREPQIIKTVHGVGYRFE